MLLGSDREYALNCIKSNEKQLQKLKHKLDPVSGVYYPNIPDNVNNKISIEYNIKMIKEIMDRPGKDTLEDIAMYCHNYDRKMMLLERSNQRMLKRINQEGTGGHSGSKLPSKCGFLRNFNEKNYTVSELRECLIVASLFDDYNIPRKKDDLIKLVHKVIKKNKQQYNL